MNFFKCAGKNSNEKNETEPTNSRPRQYDTTLLLVILSFALHLVASTKIFLYQRQMEKGTNSIELGRMNDTGSTENRNERQRKVAWEDNESNSVRRASSLPKSMADLTTQMQCQTDLVVVSIVHMVMNNKMPIELNQYENRWLAYFNQIILVSVDLLGISFRYYAKRRWT